MTIIAARNGQDTLLSEAMRYHRRGLCIIPVRKKKAAVPWERYETQRPSAAELEDMMSLPGITGAAVITGAVSAGLAIRDYDNGGRSYRRWAKRHPDLANTLPTVKTYRGYHVYHRAGSPLFVGA